MPNDQKVWTCALCGATEQNKRTQQPKKDGCEISYCEEHRWRWARSRTKVDFGFTA
ncbi:hypothetical protein [Loigolactobacillus backii]|uniref:hypothetical protein n=1 Tax=Loigolactobacillus backii TaxID=375175 RepID=UPI000B1409C2|nr:hypothetical protein [Loigolactobacillus backii]MDA5386674.1 hypothetical protein [Loigolactobacillus backii]